MDFPLPNFGYPSVYQCFYAIALEQTRACPNNCVFCAFARAGHEHVTMSKDDLCYVLNMFPKFSGTVIFSSGEVLTLKDLPDRIGLVKQAWPDCHLILKTTFNLPHDKKYIQDLLMGTDSMTISCYGHTPEDYAKIHGSNRFPVLEQNLAILGSLPAEMTDKITLRYFDNAGILFNVKAADEKREKFLSAAQKKGIKKFDLNQHFRWNPPKPVDGHALWDLPYPCDVVWGGRAGTLNVLYNLDVAPCCMTRDAIVLGNLRKNTLEEIFTGETYTAFRRAWWEMRPGDIPVCNTCQWYQPSDWRDELARMAAWQARDVRGRKAVFWGAGEAYRAYKSFFADCEPVAMLVESQEREREVDGIPLYHPADFLPTLTEPLPLVIFAMPEASPKILHKLKEDYAFYKPEKLIICPANAHIVPPVEPFFQD